MKYSSFYTPLPLIILFPATFCSPGKAIMKIRASVIARTVGLGVAKLVGPAPQAKLLFGAGHPWKLKKRE
jgi:hypothetical protein